MSGIKEQTTGESTENAAILERCNVYLSFLLWFQKPSEDTISNSP
jgi:hypothetical protein